MWNDKQIDAAIDEAARQMTAGEPGAEFRARVMARIEVRSSHTPLWRPIAVGVAVAAIVLVAVLVGPKPDAPQVRLKPDATYEAKPEAPLVRLPPSPHGGFGGPRKPDPTYDAGNDRRDLESLDLPSIDLDSIAATAL